ncbi:MAG: hypothetical protein ABIQ56_02670 [Chitinophagaceae bacterium]
MITALKEIREKQDSGQPLIASEIKTSLTNLYSENLIEPTTIDVNGEKVPSCEITQFGTEVLKQLDEEGQGAHHESD